MPKSDEEKLAELDAAQAKLKARKKKILARKSTSDRKADARKKVIYGAVVLAHAEHDPQFAGLLETIIKNRTTRETDRKFLGLPPLREAERKRLAVEAARKKASKKKPV